MGSEIKGLNLRVKEGTTGGPGTRLGQTLGQKADLQRWELRGSLSSQPANHRAGQQPGFPSTYPEDLSQLLECLCSPLQHRLGHT